MDSESLAAIRAVLARHREIELAILFGSVAKEQDRPDSDIDLAVAAALPLSAEQRLGLIGDLAEATGRQIDLVDLHTAGEPLLGQVIEYGRRIAGSDTAHAPWITRHLLDAADFLPYRRRMLAERRKAWIGK